MDGRPDQVLEYVEINEGRGRCLEDTLDDVGGDDGLGHHRLTAPLHPVNSCGLHVRVGVAGQ